MNRQSTSGTFGAFLAVVAIVSFVALASGGDAGDITTVVAEPCEAVRDVSTEASAGPQDFATLLCRKQAATRAGPAS